MKKFIEKLFRRKSSENKNEDLTSSSLIEEAVAVLLLRAANIDGKKDAKEIDAIKKLIIKQFNYDEQKTNALITLLVIRRSPQQIYSNGQKLSMIIMI